LITLGTRSMTWALPRSACTPSRGCIALSRNEHGRAGMSQCVGDGGARARENRTLWF
jgi:hypothetical protein